MMLVSQDLIDLMTHHEGLRLKPYRDTVGKLTIGVGRNLDDVGITHGEAMILLQNDILMAIHHCENYEWFRTLDEKRQHAVISMMFNLGPGGFNKFQNFIRAMSLKNYPEAAAEMLNSKWASQVGQRAIDLSNMILTGM